MIPVRRSALALLIVIGLFTAASLGSTPVPAAALLAGGQIRQAGIQGYNSPPRDGFVLRDPFVSEPVSPADTSGMPRAPAVKPFDPSTDSIQVIPNAFPHPKSEGATQGPAAADQALQLQLGQGDMPSPLTNWEGISATGVLPPDTVGQVGASHYVQVVNAPNVGAQVRIWNKSGTQLYDFGLGSLWPVGDNCERYPFGDPVVLYDQLADRWVLTQFALPDPPYYECIAVSKTGTPTNNPSDWWLYSFLVHNTKMNDYPKLGVWPDGFYMSVNQFDPFYAGVGVFVFDRAAMLTGAAATFQYFDLEPVNSNYFSLLPSNLMGSTPPPAGAPNYFVSVDQNWSGSDDIMHMFEFHTDWATPANSTFSLVADLVVATFDYDLCPNFRERCIHQPDGAPQLESLSFRVMMPLWYRNFGTHEAMVVNHTVDADGAGRAGIRWYEIRGGTVNTTMADASIYQQGTYSPDAHHRWMGSIAMDQDSNLALGYSVSSTTVYPSIRYAGRLAIDPLGALPQAEVEIIAGSGVQTHSAARWGDYSAMSVDPADDCTFWYTQEYIQTAGSALWQTRIASFKFPSCPSGLPDTPTPTNTPTSTSSPTPGPSPTPTPSATASATPTATDTPPPTATATATSTPGGSTILLVDDDDNFPDVRSYYSTALDSLGRAYDVWDSGNSDNDPSASYLSAYSTVIWFSGDEFGGFAGPGSAGESALASFLDGGNCLFISSQDYHWDWGFVTSFMSNYLGVSSITDDVQHTNATGEGGPFWGTGPYALSYPFANYSDLVSPDSTAEEAFIGDQGDAAIYKDNGVYRTSFWGFPFEALPTAADRQDNMAAILDFCDSGFTTLASFVDVPKTHGFWEYVEGIYRAGITNGCLASPLTYCPTSLVTRAQMAIFILRGLNGPGYTPPPATGIFADVDPGHWTAPWIEDFYSLGITSGCGTSPLRYCPNSYVTRTQMAVFLVRAVYGSAFVPPPATGIFADVPLDGFFDAFIEQAYNDGITLGCATSPLRYCPNGLVSRGEMAAFLARAFDLPLP